MKQYLLLITFLGCSAVALAQSAKEKQAYADEAAVLQKQIWDNQINEFKATTVPANLGKESAVVLARSFSLSRSSGGKFKFGRGISFTTRTKKFSIFHERVKINDKSALENFSSLEYQKILNKTTTSGFAKFLDVNNTYVGAKVIKPSGKEQVVNTSEEVLTKNESKDKQGKLAIPDLQVGDILDYYTCKEDVADKDEGNSYKDNDNIIFLVDEYPVLYYGIDFQFNKKIKVKTIYANGAGHFETTSNEDGDQIYSLKLHNIPKYKSQLWTSAFRQYPYIEIGSSYNDDLDKIIEKNNFYENPMFQAQKYVFQNNFKEFQYPFNELLTNLKDFYKDKKAFKNAPVDSIAKNIYAVWKFNTFCKYIGSAGEDGGGSYKERRAASKVNTINMCMALSDQKIDHDIILVSSRFTNSLDNVFNYDDFDAFIRVNGDKPMYMCFDNMATHFNEIPARYQGEKVIVLHPRRRSSNNYEFTEGVEVLPVTKVEDNNITEQLNVSLADAGMQKLKIERHVAEKGALRDDQLELLAVMDIDESLQHYANGDELSKRFKNFGDRKKIVSMIQAALDKEKGEQTKNFTAEIKGKYEQEPKDVSNCKILNTGVDISSPVFEYTETFTLDNLVKKAGNNYIIDAGKLTGGFLKLEEKNKTRDADVFMSAARGFKYTIVINIPQGYAPKGMEEMTQNKTNKTGSFVSSATLAGNKLTVSVNRTYAHHFEKAADWPLLVDVINTASDFDSKKILLEKQN